MAAFQSSSPVFIVAAAHDNSDDLATTLFVFALLLTPFVLLTVALWHTRFARFQAPWSLKQAKGGKQSRLHSSGAARATHVASAVPAEALPRRIIPLYSTTPGQSPFEYNVGDNQGTRGSAIVRAA
jgi:hypothetical protein